jgi:hypothetical protein
MLRRIHAGLVAGLPASRSPDPFAEDCIFWYAACTPLLWMTGMLMPVGFLGAVLLFIRRPPRDPAIILLSGAWIAVGAAQALSVVINWATDDAAEIGLVRGLLSLVTTGWVLIGLCIGIGGQAQLATPRVVRAVSILGGWIGAFAIISIVAAYVLGMPELSIRSPIALLLPGDMAIVRQHLTMQFYLMDALLNGRALRLTLFYPWSTTLSLAGAAILLIGTADRSLFWRVSAIFGGTAGLLFGHSRSVLVCMLASAGLLLLLRIRLSVLAAIMLGAGMVLNVAVLLGFDLLDTIHSAEATFTSVRPGSSLSRNFIYDLSWSHFLERPIFGHGWMSQPVAGWLPTMPLGSHSVFYGLLYLGGIVTFGMVCIAFATTAAVTLLRLRDRQGQGAAALALLGLFGVVALGETFNIMIPSLLIFLTWLGGALRAPTVAEIVVPPVLRPIGEASGRGTLQYQ